MYTAVRETKCEFLERKIWCVIVKEKTLTIWSKLCDF